ncbi:alpha/beta hydrolase [Taibaiella chishuiensis]|uniref:Phospholipase/carboxylesterase n=1 Tax=Taibaiella chishuiensis TaxID=1434707 RepID=A0A2P8DCT2_9BACT|nr:dienelactone hydrolase family protein [Taibaiella chishuiensis]PSK95033.1 phospholipase/carboxylesterase [Taibaiella chishuiensis]
MRFLLILILLLMHTNPALPHFLKGEHLLLHYRLREPLRPGKGKPPVIILLHGVGGNEDNLFTYANRLPEESLVIAARAPFTLQPGAYAWFHVHFEAGTPVINAEEAEKSRIILVQFINQVLEKYDADPERVFLLGFSQGAIMSYSLALSRPEKVKGILALSGRVLPEIKPVMAAGTKLQRLHVFIGHGTADAVLPISYARAAKALTEQHGIQLNYHEYPVGHETVQEEWADIAAWLKGLL